MIINYVDNETRFGACTRVLFHNPPADLTSQLMVYFDAYLELLMKNKHVKIEDVRPDLHDTKPAWEAKVVVPVSPPPQSMNSKLGRLVPDLTHKAKFYTPEAFCDALRAAAKEYGLNLSKVATYVFPGSGIVQRILATFEGDANYQLDLPFILTRVDGCRLAAPTIPTADWTITVRGYYGDLFTVYCYFNYKPTLMARLDFITAVMDSVGVSRKNYNISMRSAKEKILRYELISVSANDSTYVPDRETALQMINSRYSVINSEDLGLGLTKYDCRTMGKPPVSETFLIRKLED